MEKKRILLVTKGLPASDRRCWSGIPFSLKQQLEEEFTVVDYCINRKASILAMLKIFYYRKIRKGFISVQLLNSFAKAESRAVDKVAREEKCDCILTTQVLAAAIAYSQTDIPIIYFSDCVVSGMIDYYWFNVDKHIAKEMNDVQRRALIKSSAVVLTSNWAKRNAVNDYGIDPQKINVFPMGANLEVNEYKHEPHEGIQLLFVGVQWERKGADIAIECVEHLSRLDPDTHYTLHLVGCEPPRRIESQHVKFYGFLNRNNKDERELLDHLRAIADFFILPTRAECAGIVFCEASAYGLPSITFDTGGIEDYIKNDINGYRLPMNSGAEDFAKKIIEYSHDPERLERMKEMSRKIYEEELNWNATGNKLRQLINQQIIIQAENTR